jgi:hypothetical protein
MISTASPGIGARSASSLQLARLKESSETEMHHPAKLALMLACILIGGLSEATADDLLDLGTRDLARMKTVNGITLAFDPGKITMVYALPRLIGSARGNASITNVIGLAGGPQEIDETVDGLLERLDLKPYFITLTLPDGVPVRLKASAVSFIRAIEPWDHTRAEAKSAVSAGARPIFVKENVTAIEDAIDAVRRRNRSR